MSDTHDSAPYFLSLSVENFRCFRSKQVLDLSDGNGNPALWNVLIGENGTGKTTLLRLAFGLALKNDAEIAKDNQTSRAPQVLNLREWRHGIGWWKSTTIGKARMAAKYCWRHQEFQSDFGVNSALGFSYSGLDYHDCPDMFVIAYGVNRRAVDGASEAIVGGTLFSAEASIPSPESWIEQLDHVAKLPGGEGSPLLTLKRLLFDFLPGVTDFQVTLKDRITPQAQALLYGEWIPVRDLSDGYQTALAWIVDFATRMIERYPDSENPFAEPAVCLVDEIDLHTHPQWQRRLVKALRQSFPRTQFIVTAHSPLIVQADRDANLALLRRDPESGEIVIDNDIDHIRNWRADQILSSELFGNVSIESAEVEELLDERTRLVEKGPDRTDDDNRRIREIDTRLDQLPAGSTAQDRDTMALLREAAASLTR